MSKEKIIHPKVAIKYCKKHERYYNESAGCIDCKRKKPKFKEPKEAGKK